MPAADVAVLIASRVHGRLHRSQCVLRGLCALSSASRSALISCGNVGIHLHLSSGFVSRLQGLFLICICHVWMLTFAEVISFGCWINFVFAFPHCFDLPTLDRPIWTVLKRAHCSDASKAIASLPGVVAAIATFLRGDE